MTDIQPLIVPVDPKLTTSGLLVERVKQTPNKPLFSKLEGDDKWSDVTSKEFEQEVIAVAKGLVAKGLKPGEMIGFMGKTHYDWTLLDFAIWYAGAIMVPIYDTSSAKQIQWILSDSGSVAMISMYVEHDARVQEIIGDLPNVRFNMC
ncbi:MAG: AMP-binding protein, partial [Microbacteriaceae bacterium]|nr:AMP-binding protein [Microbacteriaceae bacterium]